MFDVNKARKAMEKRAAKEAKDAEKHEKKEIKIVIKKIKKHSRVGDGSMLEVNLSNITVCRLKELGFGVSKLVGNVFKYRISWNVEQFKNNGSEE